MHAPPIFQESAWRQEPAVGAGAGGAAAAPAHGPLAAKLAAIASLIQPDEVTDDAWMEHTKELTAAARKDHARGGHGGGAAFAGAGKLSRNKFQNNLTWRLQRGSVLLPLLGLKLE